MNVQRERPTTPALVPPATPAADDRPRPKVSVIVPTRNEEYFIERCLDSIAATAFPLDQLEVLVVDGCSTDRTRELIAGYAARHPWLRMLQNPGRTAPCALNVGIRQARGDYIVRMDSHTTYPPEYLSRLVATAEETGADNVGGRLVTLPVDGTPVSRAIAIGLSHPFGVGNAYFRIGSSKRREVDTVPFGCWRRDVFERIGLFDEELVRNQDDEFNFRLVRHGGRILLDPAIVAYYYPRRSLRAVSRMYYEYGFYKPLVARKIGRVMTVRQLVPPAFVSGLLGKLVAILLFPQIAFEVFLALIGVLLLYGMGVFYASFAGRTFGPRTMLALMAAFVTIHLSYGWGFIRGAFNLLVRRYRQSLHGRMSAAGAAAGPS